MTSGGVPLTSRWTSVSRISPPDFLETLFLTLHLTLDTFEINRERAIDYLNTRDNVYVFDGYAGVRIRSSPPSPRFSSLYALVGSQVSHQGSRYLRPSLPCPLHGTS